MISNGKNISPLHYFQAASIIHPRLQHSLTSPQQLLSFSSYLGSTRLPQGNPSTGFEPTILFSLSVFAFNFKYYSEVKHHKSRSTSSDHVSLAFRLHFKAKFCVAAAEYVSYFRSSWT